MSTKPIRVYSEDMEKLKIAAGTSGKDEKDILHELMKGVPEDVFNELKEIASVRTRKRRPKAETTVQSIHGTTEIGERLKAVIADAVETKVYLKTLGINLGDSNPQQSQYPLMYPPQYPQMQPQPQQETKKDIMTVVAELKALESLDKQTSDPEVKNMLKELKDAQVKRLRPPETPKQSSRDRMRELIELMTFYKMAGQSEEAGKVGELIRVEMTKMTDKLHQTELAMQKQQSTFQLQQIQQQLNDIKNAPTEFDQITRMSKLAESDPAIKAYMNKKLGVKEKGEPLTPEKLKSYIETIQVPVGDIIKGVMGYMQQRAPAPPPPTTEPPPLVQEVPPGLAEQHLPETPPQPTPTPPTLAVSPANKRFMGEPPPEPAIIKPEETPQKSPEKPKPKPKRRNKK